MLVVGLKSGLQSVDRGACPFRLRLLGSAPLVLMNADDKQQTSFFCLYTRAIQLNISEGHSY